MGLDKVLPDQARPDLKRVSSFSFLETHNNHCIFSLKNVENASLKLASSFFIVFFLILYLKEEVFGGTSTRVYWGRARKNICKLNKALY